MDDKYFTDLVKRVPKILKDERCRQNMSVSDLSTLSHVSKNVIYRYERDFNKISLQVVVKIVSALNLDITKVIPITPKEETIEEKFSTMVQNQSCESVDYILNIIAKIIDFYHVNSCK